MPDANQQISVSVRNLTKKFGGVHALNDVSLDVIKGEFLSLLGASGCGKTTLLRIIGGFDHSDSGSLTIGGKNVLNDPPYRRRTNMIFQHLALFPHLTVSQNIAFGLEMKRKAAKEIREKIDKALALVRLQGFEGRRPDLLSGGQKQRVAIARALVNEPEVLLLDEPLGALDLQLRLQMHEELKRIHSQTGATFIFVTHDQSEAITLSDRIAVMSDGRIVQLGTPREIYERPTHQFVARFVGHANFIEGKVESAPVGERCSLVAQGEKFTGVASQPLVAGASATAVLRYEKIVLSAGNKAGGSQTATITHVTYLGSTTRITVRLSGGLTLVAEKMTSADDQMTFKVGEPVGIAWSPDDVVVVAA